MFNRIVCVLDGTDMLNFDTQKLGCSLLGSSYKLSISHRYFVFNDRDSLKAIRFLILEEISVFY